jgi:hyaluronoglucosaminidase
MNKFSGYIEGYYGRLLTWDERVDILDALDRLSLNTYLYGPKEDPFHRQQWRLPYPGKWSDRFRQFVAKGARKNIRVIPSLSPGLSYDYNAPADYRILKKKFMAFAACGAASAALFMDDIPNVLPRSCARSFSSLGHAHGELLQCLQADIRRRYPRFSLSFCPTVYCDQFAKCPLEKNAYLLDLASHIPESIQVFWTGPSVISESIDGKNISAISGMFHGNVVIWDNLYANDYCPHRLFAGAYRGRSSGMLSLTNGICLNPTGLVNTDIMLLGRLSDFLNKGRAAPKQDARVTDRSLPREFHAVARFFDSPFSEPEFSDLTSRKRAKYAKALKYLIWDWKSPLQREWYPFLYMLDNDLKFLLHSEKRTLALNWIHKKYPPVLSSVLSRALGVGGPEHR